MLGRKFRIGFRFFGAIALLIASAANGAIQATISPPVIDEMDTAQLVLRVEGSGNAKELDVGPLQGAFEWWDTSTASQINIINGQMRSWVEYRLQLRPKRTGALEIPALTIDGQSSPTLRLQVNPLGADVRAAIDRMIFFEVEMAPNPVHVQGQALLTRRLFYASGVQVYNDLPAAPSVANALVVPLDDNNIGNVVRDGATYGVLEQRYALFPEQSGVLRIPEVSVTSAVPLPGGGGRRSGIRASAEAVEVQVLPIPAEYPADQPWLPAAAVAINEAWAPADPAFKVGRTLAANHHPNRCRQRGGVHSAFEPGFAEGLLQAIPGAGALGGQPRHGRRPRRASRGPFHHSRQTRRGPFARPVPDLVGCRQRTGAGGCLAGTTGAHPRRSPCPGTAASRRKRSAA